MKAHPEHTTAVGIAHARLRLLDDAEPVEEPADVSAIEQESFTRGLRLGIALSIPVWALAGALAWRWLS